MFRQVQRCAAVVLLCAGFAVSGCSTSARAYERAGEAGAVLFLVGGVLTPVGSAGISRKNEEAGMAVAAVGVSAQVVGALLLLWGFDGLIHAGE